MDEDNDDSENYGENDLDKEYWQCVCGKHKQWKLFTACMTWIPRVSASFRARDRTLLAMFERIGADGLPRNAFHHSHRDIRLNVVDTWN